jgi:hypothetical protein
VLLCNMKCMLCGTAAHHYRSVIGHSTVHQMVQALHGEAHCVVGACWRAMTSSSHANLRERLDWVGVRRSWWTVPWLEEAKYKQAEKKHMLQQVPVTTLQENGWQLLLRPLHPIAVHSLGGSTGCC